MPFEIVPQVRSLSAAVLASVLAACSSGSTEYPGCTAGVPPAAQLRADPAFSNMKFHKNEKYDIRRGLGYDLWADSNFDYRSGLEYSLVPRAGARSDDDLCTFAITLRFATPVQDVDRRKLQVFAAAVATSQSLDARQLEQDLQAALESGDKFRQREIKAPIKMEAGRLFHPSRGEFFMATFTWPRPPQVPPVKAQ